MQQVNAHAQDLFDCEAGSDNWHIGWSAAKTEYCCHHEGIGCHDEEHYGGAYGNYGYGSAGVYHIAPTVIHSGFTGTEICEGHHFTQQQCDSFGGCCHFDVVTSLCYSAIAHQVCSPLVHGPIEPMAPAYLPAPIPAPAPVVVVPQMSPHVIPQAPAPVVVQTPPAPEVPPAQVTVIPAPQTWIPAPQPAPTIVVPPAPAPIAPPPPMPIQIIALTTTQEPVKVNVLAPAPSTTHETDVEVHVAPQPTAEPQKVQINVTPGEHAPVPAPEPPVVHIITPESTPTLAPAPTVRVVTSNGGASLLAPQDVSGKRASRRQSHVVGADGAETQ